MTELAISLYQALVTTKYLDVKRILKPFILDAHLAKAHELGVRKMRLFADLPFYDPKTPPLDWSELLYEYDPVAHTWKWGKINPKFVAAINTCVNWGRKAPTMQFEICACTQGPDYGFPFFSKMGYPTSKDYYDRANFDEFVKSGAWGRLQQYFKDLYAVLEPFPARFIWFEEYNEGDVGMEELALAHKQDLGPHHQQLVLDMPRPIYPGTKINALRSLGVKRFAFHNVFSPADVTAIVKDCANYGIDPHEIEVETDGAAPWKLPSGKYKYTYENHQAFYKDKINWNKTAADKKGVIDGHAEILDAARHLGVAAVGFQSVMEWSQILEFEPDIVEFYEALTKH